MLIDSVGGDVVLEDVIATGGVGRAMVLERGSLSMTGSTVGDFDEGTLGGAALWARRASVSVSDSDFEHNTSAGLGGAVAVSFPTWRSPRWP